MPVKCWLAIAMLLIAHRNLAQYPFEKFPQIKYKEYRKWKTDEKAMINDSDIVAFYMVIPNFFERENLTIRITTLRRKSNISQIRLFKGKKLIGNLHEKMFFSTLNLSEPVKVANIKGDSLKDIKLIVPYMGCGLASLNVRVIYLFQKPNNKFTKISYMDMSDPNIAERDLDMNGTYEIITKTLRTYKDHNYWLFNLYNFKDNALINVNEKFNYPIMVQYLYRQNYTPSQLSKSILEKLSSKLPEEYEVEYNDRK
jgi:hypothetical protein